MPRRVEAIRLRCCYFSLQRKPLTSVLLVNPQSVFSNHHDVVLQPRTHPISEVQDLQDRFLPRRNLLALSHYLVLADGEDIPSFPLGVMLLEGTHWPSHPLEAEQSRAPQQTLTAPLGLELDLLAHW